MELSKSKVDFALIVMVLMGVPLSLSLGKMRKYLGKERRFGTFKLSREYIEKTRSENGRIGFWFWLEVVSSGIMTLALIVSLLN